MPAVRPILFRVIFRSRYPLFGIMLFRPCRAERDELGRLARLHPHEHRALAVLLRLAQDACARRPACATFLPATSRMTSPVLKPCSEAMPLGSTSVTTTPSEPLPATWPAGASVRPSRGTSVPDGLGGVRRAAARLALLRQLAEGEGDGLLLALAPHGQLDRGAGRHARRSAWRARLASFTGVPLTAVITSPARMPALAAGPFACGSETSAPCSPSGRGCRRCRR